jgi:NADH-quinone oxidoreductase subunit J
MNAQLFYAAAALGAVALFLLMQPDGHPRRVFQAFLVLCSLAAVAMLVTAVAKHAPAPAGVTDDAPFWLYVLMAMIAVSGAVRMVTHSKPVYAALYFILVILASAATLLLLQAEFMAFALIIVYAGAILITYLFVLMLAQQSGDRAAHGSAPASYDRIPREPAIAVVIGFVVLATLGDALFGSTNSLPWQTPTSAVATSSARGWAELESMPRLLKAELQAQATRQSLGTIVDVVARPSGTVLRSDGDNATAEVRFADGSTKVLRLTPDAQPSNSQSLGWALVAKFPVSLELAGVILLMAMFGAVVLARKQIEIADDDRRTAVGLPRISEDPKGPPRGGASS